MSLEFHRNFFSKSAQILQKTLDKKYFCLTKETSEISFWGPFFRQTDDEKAVKRLRLREFY